MSNNNFQVGDRVYDLVYEWGTVTSVFSEESLVGDYPIMIRFDAFPATLMCTKDGRRWAATKRTVFFQEIPIPDSAYSRPL